jgi:hypothetical protein
MTEKTAEVALFYRAWSSGLSLEHASFLSNMAEYASREHADVFITTMLRGVSLRRTKSQMRRYIIRNRRAYNHDQAIDARHARDALRARDGMRCYGCRHIPPQPGEVMDPDCVEYITGLDQEEGGA